MPALIKALKDDDCKMRRGAADAVGEIGPEARDAVPALINALKGDGYSVPLSAAHALGAIGPEAKEAIPALTEIAKSSTDDSLGDVAKRALHNIQKQ